MERALDEMRRALKEPEGFTEADILFHLGHGAGHRQHDDSVVQMEGMRVVQREVSELFSRRFHTAPMPTGTQRSSDTEISMRR